MQQLAAQPGHSASLLLDGLRRYEVAAVQRHAAGQGLPRAFLQADLDFVLPGERTVAEQLLGDAEVGWEEPGVGGMAPTRREMAAG